METTSSIGVPAPAAATERRQDVEIFCLDCDKPVCGWTVKKGEPALSLDDILPHWRESESLGGHAQHAGHTLGFEVGWARVCTKCAHPECYCCNDWCDVLRPEDCAACSAEDKGETVNDDDHTCEDDFLCCEGKCVYAEEKVVEIVLRATMKYEASIAAVG